MPEAVWLHIISWDKKRWKSSDTWMKMQLLKEMFVHLLTFWPSLKCPANFWYVVHMIIIEKIESILISFSFHVATTRMPHPVLFMKNIKVMVQLLHDQDMESQQLELMKTMFSSFYRVWRVEFRLQNQTWFFGSPDSIKKKILTTFPSIPPDGHPLQ